MLGCPGARWGAGGAGITRGERADLGKGDRTWKETSGVLVRFISVHQDRESLMVFNDNLINF